jgi:hypothetical protein
VKAVKPKAPRPPKKSSFSDREYVNQSPSEEDIATLKDQKGQEIARFLPIEVIERDLDRWAWGTENFIYQQFRDKFGKPCVSASLELVIPWKDDSGMVVIRRLAGACNFEIGSYAPNRHFVATAKSECVKNAASDLGKKFGRSLNDDLLVAAGDPAPAVDKQKRPPDKTILEQIRKFKEAGDEAAIALYANIYELNTEENEL